MCGLQDAWFTWGTKVTFDSSGQPLECIRMHEYIWFKPFIQCLTRSVPYNELKVTSYNVEITELLLKQPFLCWLAVIIAKFGAFYAMLALNHKHLLSFNVLYYSCVLIFSKWVRIFVCVNCIYAKFKIFGEVPSHHYKLMLRVIEVWPLVQIERVSLFFSINETF